MASSVSALNRFRYLRLGGMTLADYGFWVLCATAIVLLATQAVIDPRTFFQTLDFGIADGAIYALVALGYTMVYGIIELINFAHGDIFTLSAFIGSALLGFFSVNGDSLTLTNVIATNAPVRPGDSGGPLQDALGRAIGMVTAGSTSGPHRGFAITIRHGPPGDVVPGGISARTVTLTGGALAGETAWVSTSPPDPGYLAAYHDGLVVQVHAFSTHDALTVANSLTQAK